jgi:membrane protease YdiL (CAAX protease family)
METNNEIMEVKKERKKAIISIIFFIVTIEVLCGFVFPALFAESSLDIVKAVTYIIVLVCLVAYYFQTLKSDFKRLTAKNWIFVVVMGVLVLVLNMVSGPILSSVTGQAESENQAGIGESMSRIGLLIPLMAAIYGPVAEELIYRKALNGIIKNSVIFAVVSALVFGLIHDQTIGVIGYVVPGLIFALVYLKTGKNVAASIVTHFINNGTGALLMILLS